jgi:DNA mismatch endonuclease, patch repair protein
MALTRSENMSRIHSYNTQPEIRLRSALWKKGIRYRLNRRIEGIKPDLVLTKSKIVIFVDGCQWHGCPTHYVKPRTKMDFWQQKLNTTIERDIRQTKILQNAGWTVYRVLEHEIWDSLPQVVDTVRSLMENKTEASEDWRVFRVDIIDPEVDLERRHMCRLTIPNVIQSVDRIRSTTKWSRRNGSLND